MKTIKNRKIICINRKVNNTGWGDKLRKAITSFFIAFLLLASLLVAGAAAQPSQKIPVIVGFKDKSDAGLLGKHGGDVKYQYSTISAIACSLPQGAIDALERNPRIAYIEFDGKVQMTQEEPPFSMMYPPPFDGVDRIDAELVHPDNKGTGVKVAILDTGIDYLHTYLSANYEGGDDFVNGDGDPMDDNGHGTHVAGIVAAEDNEEGVIGVAPEASLYAVKVLDATGSGDVSDVIAGIQWSITNGMHIISMSLRSTVDNQALHDICDTAYYEHGILVVAAAGNDYRVRGRNKELDTVGYPARYDSVIAVGATDNTDTRAGYSSTGSALELVAPGDYINSTMLGNTYALGSGTSMACPHVTGTTALILSSDSELSASEVRNRLQNTADDLGSPGLDSWYGYGLVDANAEPGAPSITKLIPAVGAFINTANPTISAIVTDADCIASRQMMLDGGAVDSTYDVGTGLVSPVVLSDPSLVDGRHTVTLTVSDGSNKDVTSWSFTVDTEAPDPVTGVTVDPISSNSLFISWDASTDPDLAEYKVYKMAPGETEHTFMNLYVCTYSEGDPPRAGFFPDTGLEPDSEYSYQITAVDRAGNEGDRSDAKSGTTEPTPATGEIHVARILLNWRYVRINRKSTTIRAEAMVAVVDVNNVPVPGATVSGSWEGETTDSDSGVTDDMGVARLGSDTVRNPPAGIIFTFVVEDVDLSGWEYDSSGDTSNSIMYP
jgi:subtilisin family serine protease